MSLHIDIPTFVPQLGERVGRSDLRPMQVFQRSEMVPGWMCLHADEPRVPEQVAAMVHYDSESSLCTSTCACKGPCQELHIRLKGQGTQQKDKKKGRKH